MFCAWRAQQQAALIRFLNKEQSMETILKSTDACQILSISKPTLYRLTSNGKLTKVKISQGRVGWLKSSIDDFIANLERPNPQNP